LTYNAHYVV